jgi:FkbH-like protein
MFTFKELKKNLKKDNSQLPVLKIALLGDTATQFLTMALKGIAIERKYNLTVFEAEYNQIESQFLNQTSELYTFHADYVVVFQSTHKLLSVYNKHTPDEQANLADERIKFVQVLCNVFPGRLIYFNYPEIDDTIFGSFANKIEHSFTWQIRKLNYELMNISSHNPNLFICDIASLQHKFGRDILFYPTMYVSTEMVLSLNSIPYIASRIMDIVCAAQGQFKKCLILDLDNTLWGGVIGDDGLENIQLGHGLGIGKIFSEFQYWIKKLKNRGIIIAVCSKNDEETAKEPFLKHPDMVLKLEDISVFIANWDNKVDNIHRIQSMLNIGFDSMVFLDDNPAERAIVQENIAGITVPELPEDPADYLEYLYGLNLFETVSYSAEDMERTQQYQKEAQRTSSKLTFTNEADFLKSLDMVSEVRGFDAFNIPRVAQLSQRSNQFNLRTIRYTEVDIERLASDNRYKNFTFTLKDKFGDNGLVCVVILEKQDMAETKFPETLFIDTWLMSCRVLKRGMENFALNTIVSYAHENGFKRIIGEYIVTPKNKMVEEHYQNLGFMSLMDIERHLYVLQVYEYEYKECFIASL